MTVERVRHVARITDPKHKATFEKLDNAREVSYTFIIITYSCGNKG